MTLSVGKLIIFAQYLKKDNHTMKSDQFINKTKIFFLKKSYAKFGGRTSLGSLFKKLSIFHEEQPQICLLFLYD